MLPVLRSCRWLRFCPGTETGMTEVLGGCQALEAGDQERDGTPCSADRQESQAVSPISRFSMAG